MKKAAICFTPEGQKLAGKINDAAEAAGLGEAGVSYLRLTVMGDNQPQLPGVQSEKYTGSLSAWAGDHFQNHDALIFIGAAGIAVRAIASCIRDKLEDSPVIVIDDLGRFVIPLLSGHAGGANKLAATIAKLIGAIPVITTSTDIHGAFSADVFAAEYGLQISNREGIKKVSAKAIEGKPVTLSVKGYPPEVPVDLIVSDETDREYSLLLKPKPYTLGVGMKRNTEAARAEEFLKKILSENEISLEEIYAVCTIECKQNEAAIRSFCDRYRLPLITFDAEILKKVQGNFTASAFVEKTVGVDNVCERAAVLGAGPGGELVLKKHAAGGITAAIAKRRRFG